MGVTGLWTILAPVKEHKVLGSLHGETLAVDLSIWVCETKCVKQMQGIVTKPYLRNLFFRVSHLTQLGVKLVFVIDGQAPELKWQEMSRRQLALGRGRGSQAGKGGRSNFNRNLKECCELLDILGIPYIQSKGEAEAMCAALNACGLVDACITDDGDAFLYGAKKVYRNFTMNSKDPHVESYSMASIETNLGLNRQKLVGMALLLGCDYLPGGVHGVGLERVIKLMFSLADFDILKRFKNWATISPTECVDKVEMFVRQKALAVSDFPQKQVICEFLSSKETTPSRPFSWRRPLMQRAQSFAEVKLEWPTDYTLEKVLPLVTLWDLMHISLGKDTPVHHLEPHRIVKTRVRHGISVYEVEWHKEVLDTSYSKDYYVTLEEQSLFTQCFPSVVEQFTADVTEAKQNKRKGSRKKTTKLVKDPSIDELALQVDAINLDLHSKSSVDGNDKQNLNIKCNDDKEKKRLLEVEHTATIKECDKTKLKIKGKHYPKDCTDVEVKSKLSIYDSIQPVISNNVQPIISNVQQNTIRPVISYNVQPIISTKKNSSSLKQQTHMSTTLKRQTNMSSSSLREASEVVQNQIMVDSDEGESDEELVLSLTQRLQLKLGGNKRPTFTSLNVCSQAASKLVCETSVKEASRQECGGNSKTTKNKGLNDPLKNCFHGDLENSRSISGKEKCIMNVERTECNKPDLPCVSLERSDHSVLKSPIQAHTIPAVSQTEFSSKGSISSKPSNILNNNTEFCLKENVFSGCPNSFVDLTESHEKENCVSPGSCKSFVDKMSFCQKENLASFGGSNSSVDQTELCEEEMIISSGGFNCLSLKDESHIADRKPDLSQVENNKTTPKVCTPNSSSHDFSHLLGMITSFPTPQVDHSMNRQVHRLLEKENMTMCNSLMLPNSVSTTDECSPLQHDKKFTKNISIDFGNFCMQTSLWQNQTCLESPCEINRNDSSIDCCSNKTPLCIPHYKKQTSFLNSPLLFDSPEKSFNELNHSNPRVSIISRDQAVPSIHCHQTVRKQNYEKQIVNEEQTAKCEHSEVHSIVSKSNKKQMVKEEQVAMQTVHNCISKNNEKQTVKAEQMAMSKCSEIQSDHCDTIDKNNCDESFSYSNSCHQNSFVFNTYNKSNTSTRSLNQFFNATSVSLNDPNQKPQVPKKLKHLAPNDKNNTEMFLKLDMLKSKLDDIDLDESQNYDCSLHPFHNTIQVHSSNLDKKDAICDKSGIKECDIVAGRSCLGYDGRTERKEDDITGKSWIVKNDETEENKHDSVTGKSWIVKDDETEENKHDSVTSKSWIVIDDEIEDNKHDTVTGKSWIVKDDETEDKKHDNVTGKSWIVKDDETEDKKHDNVTGKSWIVKDDETEDKKHTVTGKCWIVKDDETEDNKHDTVTPKSWIVEDDETEEVKHDTMTGKSWIGNGKVEDKSSVFYSSDNSVMHSPAPLCLADRLGCRLTKNAQMALQSMSQK